LKPNKYFFLYYNVLKAVLNHNNLIRKIQENQKFNLILFNNQKVKIKDNLCCYISSLIKKLVLFKLSMWKFQLS